MPVTLCSHIAGQWLGSTPDQVLTSAVNGDVAARQADARVRRVRT